MSEPLWTIHDIADYLQVSVSAVKRLRHRDPTFPQPIRISHKVVRWPASDVQQWIVSRQERPRRAGRPPKPIKA